MSNNHANSKSIQFFILNLKDSKLRVTMDKQFPMVYQKLLFDLSHQNNWSL